MRELKFRAWDPKSGKMFSGIPFPNDCAGDGNFGEASYYVDESTYAELKVWDWDECIWMQYTGLKDCNGKDVYVGDIVNCSCGCPHEVLFMKEVVIDNFGGMPGFYLSGLRPGYAWTGYEEIIGNIYEDPELLNS